ncbi:MAG: hypothetical protein WC233_05300 [Sphaerochaeta sp.]|jgi:hypothetical protein|nr:hypothetical protein [Spirochaetales bacterium]
MHKKILALLLLLALLVPVSIGARSLVNVSLGFGAAYYPEEGVDFSNGLENPDNWLFHGELSARLAFLQAQALVFPIQSDEGGQGILLVGMGSLSLPIIGSLLSLELGGGVGLTYVPTTSTDSRPYYILADHTEADASAMSFGDALWRSPLYLQAGLASELGPIGIRLRYLMASKATLSSLVETKEWWSMFNLETGAVSLVLSLKMF